MTKNEFISALNSQLSGIPEGDRKDMIYDYEEHFRFALEEGKTEEQICNELGDPKEIVKQYKLNYKVTRAAENPSTRNIFSAVLAGISLGFFNLVLFLPIFLGVFFSLFGFFVSAVGITLSGVLVVFSPIVAAIAPGFVTVGMNLAAAIFFGIGLTALGLLFFIGDCYLGKYFYQFTIKYLRWNVNVVKGNKGLER